MDIFSEAITTHVFMLFVFLSVMVFNLYSVLSVKDFVVLAKRLKFMTPLYHSINAVVIYTGMIVAAYSHDLSPTIILMIASGIFLLVIEIKRYKKQRVIKVSDTKLQEEFYIYAKKIYIIEISVLTCAYILSKLF